MKALILILLIIVTVVLFALFGPAKPQPVPTAKPGQPATVRPAPPAVAVTPPPQTQLSPRQRGELSTPAQATGVTTETVDVGGGGATFEAKRRMTDKLRQLGPTDKKR